VLSRFVGAVLRACIVVLVVSLPALVLPGTTQEGAELVVLVALVLGMFTAIEYSSPYPALIEFRDAPPFNRVRLLSLVVMLLCLSLVAGGNHVSSLVLVLNAVGVLFGHVLEYPGSPMAALIHHLPTEAPPVSPVQVKVMSGLSIFVCLAALCSFSIMLRTDKWPHRGQSFNVWINLPTFDPTAGGDVINRLIRDARVNFILGLTIVFILPTVVLMVSDHLNLPVLTSPHGLVWGIALWMFLPLSLFMRALAMVRIASMIRERRARLVAAVGFDAAQPA